VKRMIALVTLAVATLATVSAAAIWKPGAPYYVAEEDASTWYERVYDHAYCDGIARFGKRGEFPYEEYLRFDCSATDSRYGFCDFRARSVKASRRGYFRMKLVRGTMDCS